MSEFTVLVYKGEPWSSTFGRYRDQWLWNRAWCTERFGSLYDTPKDFKPRVSKEGRSWLGIVNEKGIAELKALGWEIRPARVEVLPAKYSHSAAAGALIRGGE